MRNSRTETSYHLQKWHRGDRESLDALLKQHIPWIQAHVHKRLGPKLRRMMETTDIVQEAAIQFLQYGPRFHVSDAKHFRALLARIVENVLRDKNDWYSARRRELARERPLPSDTILSLDPPRSPVRTPSKIAQRHEDEAWIRLGIELLEPEEREVLVLRQWDNLSFAEIGLRLGISSDAAWMRHRRAILRMAKIVAKLRGRKLDSVLYKRP